VISRPAGDVVRACPRPQAAGPTGRLSTGGEGKCSGGGKNEANTHDGTHVTGRSSRDRGQHQPRSSRWCRETPILCQCRARSCDAAHGRYGRPTEEGDADATDGRMRRMTAHPARHRRRAAFRRPKAFSL
jgi:hypothetical protein